MLKKSILSVLVLLSLCSYSIPAYAGDDGPSGPDVNGLPTLPHRAPRRPVSTLSTYLDESTNSFFIVFNKEVSDITIKVNYEGILKQEYYYYSLVAGQYEILSLDEGYGIYTIEVTSNGNTIYYNSIDYTGDY